jgi:hypothetical protein
MTDLSKPPAMAMFDLSTAHWQSCCIYVAARLGIADILAKGPRSATFIAKATGSNESAIFRLLRALASIQIFRENEAHEFEMTELGSTLTSEEDGSMLAWVLTMLGERFIPWGQLEYSIQTGEPSFKHIYGIPVWEYYNTYPDKGTNYIRAIEQHTRPVIRNTLAAYDFSQFPVIADIGGGNGSLLFSILDKVTGSRGILFDQAKVVTAAEQLPEWPKLANRCTIIAGDFFETIRIVADCFILKNILHDWNDDKALHILRSCSQAMKKNNKLLLMEAVIPEGNEAHPGKFMDINMLVVQGGRERTEEEFKQMSSAAGLQYLRTIHTGSPECSIIELIKFE